MTTDELVVLLPQIQELIEAYEKGTRKALTTGDAKQANKLALSLHISPIRTARFAMNAMDSASITPEEMENEYKMQLGAQENQEIQKSTGEKIDKFTKDYLGINQDCEIVGGDEWYDKRKVVDEDISLGKMEIPKKVGYRLTNPMEVTVNVSPLFLFPSKEKRSGKDLADCYNCKAVYTSKVMYPSLEVMWEFEKLLKELLSAIQTIKNNMNPASLYSSICNIKAFVGKNLLCPSMMGNINLMLPTLFMKYSSDLGKVAMDANFVLGGIFKVAISWIVAFLENIRALVIPFIDCVLNASKAVGGYIRSVSKAISQGVDEVAALADKTAQILHKGTLLLGEVFTNDPTNLKGEVEKLKAEQEKAKEELEILIHRLGRGDDKWGQYFGDSFLRRNESPLPSTSKRGWMDNPIEPEGWGGRFSGAKADIPDLLNDIEGSLLAIELLFSYYPKSQGGTYEGDFKKNPLILMLQEDYLARTGRSKSDFWNLTGGQFQTLLINYLISYHLEADSDELGEERHIEFDIFTDAYLNPAIRTDIPRALRKREREIVYDRRMLHSTQKNIRGRKSSPIIDQDNKFTLIDPVGDKRDALKKAQERYQKKRDSLAEKMHWREKKIFDYNKMIAMEGMPEDKVITSKYLENRYSFNLQNSYVDHEYPATKKVKAGLKHIVAEKPTAFYQINSIAELLDSLLVKPCEEAKKFVNDFFGNTINALKNLNIMLEQNTFSQFKILGEILQLTHIIRAFYLIEKLIDEGFEGCEKLSKNKEQEKILKDTMEAISDSKISAEVISKKDPELNSEEEYLKIYAKKGNYSHLTKLSDCSEVSEHLHKATPDLDAIYNAMKEGLI
jgi:hypothetical protein